MINEYTILFFSVLIGGSLGFLTNGVPKEKLNYFLSFSAAYILGITALDLIPMTFDGTNPKIGIWLLVGFLIQLLLEYISGGVEHGHLHTHIHKSSYAIQVLIGLSLHAFIEGLPVSGSHELAHHHEHITGNHYLMAIVLHKAPAAFVLVALFFVNKYKKSLIITCLLIFSTMTPLGVYVGHIIHPDPELIRIFMSIVIGSFLHISTTILFESDQSGHHHHLPWKKLLVILVGLSLAVGSVF